MAKLMQICASKNDLFGLDGDGVVYQYNFNTNGWVRLGDARTERAETAPGARPAPSAERPPRTSAPPGRRP